jgi:isoleucyl-tRNA synthetase
MSKYRDTLNLPHTDFPMKANLASREPEILKHWQEQGLYEKRLHVRQNAEPYVLHDGPPYANARPHLGTALNKIIKDIIIKSKFLEGMSTPYVPGWDCHGLPIELNVEKKYGKPGRKLNYPEFRAACREYANTQIDLQREDFVRMGILGEWNNPYLTMHSNYEADVVRGLIPMLAKGYLRRGKKPIYWCPDCASALAEAEVEYKDKTSDAIYVGFKIISAEKFAASFAITTSDFPQNVMVAIWTTTPWTIPANQAVTLHAELDYVLLQHAKTVIIIAEDLLPKVVEKFGWEKFAVLGTTKGSALEHLELQHPLLDKTVPIILGDHVTTDAGTGCVHTAPSHGDDDYKVCNLYNIEPISVVMSNSCFIDDLPYVAGQHVYKANPIVIAALLEQGLLLHQSKLEHSYPHCWRHKQPLIFRATSQWFIAMDAKSDSALATLRDIALQEIKDVAWTPSWGEKRIHNMVATRPDWCISRQRCWGSPLALIVHKETGDLHPDMLILLEKIADVIEAEGSDAWFESEVSRWLQVDADKYEKVIDTLDVWFDSGMTHQAVLERRSGLKVPAELYFEGSDQHRGWFQSSLLTSVAVRDHAPYKAVLTHGYVVDAKGHKMSKSIGNVVAPSEVVQKYGADILRLWAASANVQEDVHVSDEILKRTADAYRRIRNTARFLLSNLNDFDPTKDMCAPEEMLALDVWVVQESLGKYFGMIRDSYAEYHIHIVSKLILEFCVNTLGAFYLDVIKDRMYTCAKDSVARRSGQTAIYHVLNALVRWMAPILSFTAEEIWHCMPDASVASVFLTEWYKVGKEFKSIGGFTNAEWQRLAELRDLANKELEQKRAEGVIGGALDARVIIYVEDADAKLLNNLGDELRFLLLCSQAEVKSFAAATSAAAVSAENIAVEVVALTDSKCERCWQLRPEVGTISGYEEICGRCVTNVSDAKGERRLWV